MGKPTSEKVLKIIEAKNRQGFDFTVNYYSYRDMKLRQVVKQLTKQGLVNVKRNKDLFIVNLKQHGIVRK